MTRSFRNMVAAAVSAVAVFAVVTVAGSAAAQTQITGCCIGPTCSNQNERTCKASGGTALDSTCKNANDPRCAGCSSVPGTVPRGLCNAYCTRLDCPTGDTGQACDQLRRNWTRATGLEAFPCDVPDRPACCQCPGAGPACSSVKRCLKAQCQIIDRCINGECPKPECCECPNEDPSCRDNVIPGLCKRHGCKPEAGAVCTERGRCETCPCGTECKNAAGDVGRCVNDPGSLECECKIPAPCGLNAAGQCGGECDDSADECMVVTDAAGIKKCECVQPCGKTGSEQCGGACSEPGYVCKEADDGDCDCVPPADPCLNRVPCDATCVDPLGNAGICRDTATGCRCSPPPTGCPATAACAGPCVTDDNKPGKCTPGVDGVVCACQPPPQPCNESDPDTCDGLCTVAGTLCLPDPNGGPCRCQPPTKCQDSVAPQCGGVCPAPLSCQSVDTANVCLCLNPPPCEASTAPQCGGSCTAPDLVCTAIDNGGLCGCRPKPCDTAACLSNSPCTTTSGITGVCTDNGDGCECITTPQ